QATREPFGAVAKPETEQPRRRMHGFYLASCATGFHVDRARVQNFALHTLLFLRARTLDNASMRPALHPHFAAGCVSLALACSSGSSRDPMSGFTSGNQTSLSADDETDTGDGDDCGNGQVDPGEECDLGPDNSPEGQCTPDCTITECGDGYHNPTYEECDDGNDSNTDECVAGCKLATCGAGYTQAGVEECDDGNDDPADGCTPMCVPGSCGDGVVQDGEQCDDGNRDTTDECLACQFAFCGDGYTPAGIEQCDDGNDDDSDG